MHHTSIELVIWIRCDPHKRAQTVPLLAFGPLVAVLKVEETSVAMDLHDNGWPSSSFCSRDIAVSKVESVRAIGDAQHCIFCRKRSTESTEMDMCIGAGVGI